MLSAELALKQYRYLVAFMEKLPHDIPAAHNSIFNPNDNTKHYYQTLYIDQVGTNNAKERPKDENCKYCESFHLNNLKKIDKSKDIKLGNSLEEHFEGFVNFILRKKNMDAICKRADTEDLHMPDFKIINTISGKPLLYFEFKVIFRAFIKISASVNQTFKCYSHSLTLDVENGKKLLEQRKRVEMISKATPVIYLYLYDIPCIKGIFWLNSEKVYKIMDDQLPYGRRVVRGDFSLVGKKNSATNKIYLPLFDMQDFGSFFELIERS